MNEPDQVIFSKLRADVSEAAERLWAVARDAPYVLWRADRLRELAGVSGPCAMIALFDLEKRGYFELDNRLRVGIPHEHRAHAKRVQVRLYDEKPPTEHPGPSPHQPTDAREDPENPTVRDRREV